MHGWGEVIAIEAQERVFYALAGNITLNNCFNARAIWAAVGEERGVINVPSPDYFTPSSFGSLEIRKTERTEFIGQAIDYGNNTVEVRKLPLDDFNLPRCDLIKLDVEGMELEALEGAAATIERCTPIMLIEKIKTDADQLRQWLERRGYKTVDAGINMVGIHARDPSLADIIPQQA
jgi:FkbM family methyltransferase